MTTRINPGGPMKRGGPARPAHHRVQPYRPPGLPRGVNPGGPMKRIQPVKKAGHAKKARGWSPGVAQCCVAQALAASMEALGRPVDGDAVLDLYWRTARSAGAGASILATLEAACEFGLGGVKPLNFSPAGITNICNPLILGLDLPEGPHAVFAPDGCAPGGAVVEEAWAVTWA